ncbi:hypothetical protein PHSY_005253 [Pseudozyma hubeiensis SY62]|uniref:Uncharacterized protein n=1 Tax=Pseudozyma hubeiensis (strain SY62) TaxID=1305764 RepID=R9P8T0_PSEHS|nr:hypothetical protein PHSY_005253 [Pseudozyma hubeiensis SY62]GAC97667.1 hypothetical protein PHSY_005253 [Pseudozyma hubeiensis SY62]
MIVLRIGCEAGPCSDAVVAYRGAKFLSDFRTLAGVSKIGGDLTDDHATARPSPHSRQLPPSNDLHMANGVKDAATMEGQFRRASV